MCDHFALLRLNSNDLVLLYQLFVHDLFLDQLCSALQKFEQSSALRIHKLLYKSGQVSLLYPLKHTVNSDIRIACKLSRHFDHT